MLGDPRVLLINSLTSIEYDIQHIPGSINVPLYEMDDNKIFPLKKNTTLIFYCMGRRCLYSKKASLKAMNLGYKNVYWFEGGIPDWYRFNYPMTINESLKSIRIKKLSPTRVAELIKEHNVTILDVRPNWWNNNNGAIEQSLYLPLVRLQHTYQQIPNNTPIIVTDALMRQSPSAARFLINKNFNVLGVLKGGITRWEKEGFPIVKRQKEKDVNGSQ